MNSKTDLRIWAKSVRKTLDLSAKSIVIADKIRQLEVYKSARNVMLYYPKRYELDLTMLFEDNKNFYLPRVCGNILEVCPYQKGDQLVLSEFKINEPSSNPISAKLIDLIIVPALAVDKLNYRLGYGGGFYDRLLSENPVKSILPISKELVVDKLPVEDYDVPVDVVITD